MNPTVALEALGWYSSILPKTRRQRFVCDGSSMTELEVTDSMQLNSLATNTADGLWVSPM